MPYREITLDDWERFGEGGEAASYNCKSDKTKMLKLFFEGQREEAIAAAVNVTDEIVAKGIKTPAVIERVRCEGRDGIIFERVQNKRSFSRIMADEPDRVEECGVRFTDVMKKLHTTEFDPEKIPGRMDALEGAYDNFLSMGFMTESQHERAVSVLKSMKQVNTGILFDCTPGNVLEADGELYIIDLGTFALADPRFDVAYFAWMPEVLEDEIIENTFHIDRATYRKFRDAGMRNYLGTDNEKEIREYMDEVKALEGVVVIGSALRFGKQVNKELVEMLLGK